MALPLEQSLQILNEVYYKKFNSVYFSKMRKKLGLIVKSLPEDEKLIQDLLNAMEVCALLISEYIFVNSISNLVL